MKDQYFGDWKDFFKFDLTLTLLESVDQIQRFVYIPMLTANDGGNDGKDTRYAGNRRSDLHQFFLHCVDTDDRHIENLRQFMRNKRIEYHPYLDHPYGAGEACRHQDRESYFRGARCLPLARSVILLDPDNGLWVPSADASTAHKYLKYCELDTICSQMSESSLALVFQYVHPGYYGRPYIDGIANQILTECSAATDVSWVARSPLAFFAVAKNRLLAQAALGLVQGYADECGDRYCFGSRS